MRELVVNETVVKNLGIKTAQEAIGRKGYCEWKSMSIVGVVKDFHVNSLRDAIGSGCSDDIERFLWPDKY